MKLKLNRILRRGLLGLTFTGLALLTYGTLVEPRRFTVRRLRLAILPPGSQNIKILHLSDLHMTEKQLRKVRWVQGLTRIRPDIIVNTGDNLGSAGGLDNVASALSAFSTTDGSAPPYAGIYVWGSNDYFGPKPKNPLAYLLPPSRTASVHKSSQRLDIARLKATFDANGWLDANNNQGIVTVKGIRIAVSGVDDPHLNYDRYTGFSPKKLSAARDVDIRFGVAHAPYQRILNRMTADGADVIFAGHTHGGQLCLPGGRAIVTNCDLPRQYAKGLTYWKHGVAQSFLNVSAGLGTSKYAPLRFLCPPEVTLITLASRNSEKHFP